MSAEINPQVFDARRLSLAQALLENRGIWAQGNSQIIGMTPFAEEFPPNQAVERINTMAQINRQFPEMRSQILEICATALWLDDRKPKDVTSFVASLERTENPRYTKYQSLYIFEANLTRASRIGFNEDRYKVAVSHVGVAVAASLYKDAREEADKNLWLAFVQYYAALESLYSGVKTNTTLFALYPEKFEASFLDDIFVLVTVKKEDQEKQRLRILFEGQPVSPIIDLGNGKSFFFTK